MKRVIALVAAAIVVATAVAAVAVASTHRTHPSGDRNDRRLGHSRVVRANTVRAVRAHIALLRDARAAVADNVGVANARQALQTTRLQVLGASEGGPLGKTCVSGVLASMPNGASGACVDNATFNKQGVVAVLGSGSGQVDVVGLVPDGVTSVGVALSNGSEQTLGVTDNGYSLYTSETPTSVSFAGPNGTQQTIDLASK